MSPTLLKVLPEDETVEAVELPEEQWQHYIKCRDEGTGHKLAMMFATQQTPYIKSDCTFLHGHCNGNQFEKNPEQGDFIQSVAKEEGVDTTGAVYMGGLAEYPGDPRAWVRSRDDVRRICTERGWDCDGSVTVRAAHKDHAPGPAVADDIVDAEVHKMILDSPEPIKESIPELREKVLEARRPHWKE